MQVAQVDFLFGPTPNSFTRGDEELEHDRFAYASFLLSQWSAHGQRTDGYPFVETESGWRAWLIVLDVDSLQAEHDDHHAKQHREKLRQLNVSVEIQMLGEDGDHDERRSRQPCPCEKLSSAILYTQLFSEESPLRCGDCFGLVPLYQVPFEDEKRYQPHDDIRSWMRNYRGCDTLQLGCTLAEKWALRQMGRPKSKLSKEGRKLCRRLEKLLGVPVYYYLHRYYGKSWKREEARRCPRCKGEWRLPEELHKQFDFRCDKCRLLSNIAMDLGD